MSLKPFIVYRRCKACDRSEAHPLDEKDWKLVHGWWTHKACAK